MKCVSTSLVCLSSLFLAACQPADDMPTQEAPAEAPVAEAPPPAAPAPEPEGQTAQTTNQASLLAAPNWAILFAGHDLTSFNQVGEAQWNIVDDYVEGDGYTNSYLVTKGHYTDFLLELEFWPGAGANSGIFIRNDNADAIAASDGYEVNIFDTNENPDNRTGSIVGHMPPMETVPTEEKWNTYQITAQGNRILVRVNGTVTADHEDASHPNGPIAFQNNGGLIRFRNIRIRPL